MFFLGILLVCDSVIQRECKPIKFPEKMYRLYFLGIYRVRWARNCNIVVFGRDSLTRSNYHDQLYYNSLLNCRVVRSCYNAKFPVFPVMGNSQRSDSVGSAPSWSARVAIVINDSLSPRWCYLIDSHIHRPSLSQTSMSDDSNNTSGGGRSLGGDAAEPLPSNWSRPAEKPRVGRIGDWSGSSSSR